MTLPVSDAIPITPPAALRQLIAQQIARGAETAFAPRSSASGENVTPYSGKLICAQVGEKSDAFFKLIF